MSYILEALKRADAERDRGAVPTLHSHAIPAAANTKSRTPVANWIAAIALLALVVLGALWWTLGRQPAPVTPVVLAPVALPPPAPPPAVVAAAPAMPAAPVAPAIVTPPRPAPAAAPRKTAEPQRAATPRPAASAVAAAPPQAPNPAPRASAPHGLIYNVGDLPDDIRAQLPKLAISGVTYSAQAAYRMLIVNGQVLHEGDEPAPGLTLETIRQKDMVLRFKGYRYSVGY